MRSVFEGGGLMLISGLLRLLAKRHSPCINWVVVET